MLRRPISTFSATIVGVFEGQSHLQCEAIDDSVRSFVNTLLCKSICTGKNGEKNIFISPNGEALAIVGIGSRSAPLLTERIRNATSDGYHLLKKLNPAKISVDLMEHPQEVGEAVALASYDFCLKTTNAKNFIEFTPLQTQFNHKSWKAGILRGNMQNLARELVDTPANMMTPESFCQRIRQHLKTDGLDSLIEVNEFGPEEIKTNEMNCFLAVSQGSVVPPRLLILNYRGSKDETKTHTVIVGKGITFDSGGISLKPSTGMASMKGDMSGAAASVCALIGAANLKIPKNIVAVIPLCENMPSGNSIKPGDVVFAMNGLSVEVDNTDAEGRLILADALHYAQKFFEPDTLIDVASLTGAMCIAVGPFYSGVYSNCDGLWMALNRASQKTGDWVWRMPLWEGYDDLNKSMIADLKNNPNTREGSANAAARFLSKFIKPNQKWAHVDIAPVYESNNPYFGHPKRATGRPTRLLIDFLENLN